jgi:hypothetical protein
MYRSCTKTSIKVLRKVKLQTKWSGRKSYRNEFMVLHLECMIVSGIENDILNQAKLIEIKQLITTMIYSRLLMLYVH